MKKILLLMLCVLMIVPVIEAKDYAKLQLKEMQKAQQYGTTNKYFEKNKTNSNITNTIIKDPKILKLGGYETVSNEEIDKKKAKDDKKYKDILKNFKLKDTDNFNTQAYAKDFYQLYRITERIIRANNLDYINWRISVENDKSFNASSSDMNCITINTGLYDTLRDNDDALALVIGHEIAHALLGHRLRNEKYIQKMERAKRMLIVSPYAGVLAYKINQKRYMSNSRKMEYAADIEGAKLISKAGYNLNSAREVITSLNTMSGDSELYSTHPSPKHRIQNYDENRIYFMEDEWKKQGIYNLYKSDVLDCQKSSDRHSIIIVRNSRKNCDTYYKPETMSQMYLRYAYGSYKNGQNKDAINYFEKSFELDKSNASAYLYASYACEAMYKQTGNSKYLDDAKNYANYAKNLDKNNQYIIEQIEAL